MNLWGQQGGRLRFLPWRTGGKGAHLDLEEIRAAVEACRAQGGGSTLPAHLDGCATCRELFLIVWEGATPVSEATLRRYENLCQPPPAAWRGARPAAFQWVRRAAAVGGVLLVAGLLLDQVSRRTTAAVTSGAVVTGGGTRYSDGAGLPGRRMLTVKSGATVSMRDGSELDIGAGTKWALAESSWGGTRVDVGEGAIEFRVSRRKVGQVFRVRTAAGDVEVVGTAFRVTSRTEPLAGGNPMRVERENDGFHITGLGRGSGRAAGDSVTTVMVTVREGHVRIRRFGQAQDVLPGQTVVMRDDRVATELFEDTRLP